MKFKTLVSFAALAVASTAVSGAAHARDQVQIAGSSTVLPYASIVAEAFGATPTSRPRSSNPAVPLPVSRVCDGVGENTVDIANASRPIREKEVKACAKPA